MRSLKRKKEKKELPGEAWHVLARRTTNPMKTLVAGGRAGDRLVFDEFAMLRPAIHIEQMDKTSWFVSIGDANRFWVVYNSNTGGTTITHEERD